MEWEGLLQLYVSIWEDTCIKHTIIATWRNLYKAAVTIESSLSSRQKH